MRDLALELCDFFIVRHECHSHFCPQRPVIQCDVQTELSFHHMSPRAHLHVVGMLRFVSNKKQPRFPTLFYSVLVFISVSMALSTVFHSINSPYLVSALLVLSTIHLFIKVSLSPDITLCG